MFKRILLVLMIGSFMVVTAFAGMTEIYEAWASKDYATCISEADKVIADENVSTYPEIMENYEHFFSTCKAIAPKLPVGLCVTLVEWTMYDWLKACPFKFDMLCVFNITKMGANFEKIQKRFPNQRIMVGGMNAGENAKYGGTAYKNYIKKLKKLGFIGSIFFK